ncbi:MAG: VIT1/CCC1 transporter family protein [Caulobacteraceae bacterium]|nr:VIT1/CCC1 transporter family protein [Caulobacteraceae bacterium]
MASTTAQARRRANRQAEVDSAAVYEALAEAEHDARIAGVYRRLAAVERAHAEFWAGRLGHEPAPAPSLKARFLSLVSSTLGPAAVLPIVARNEAHDSSGYDDQPEAVAQGMAADERSHARIVQAAAHGVGGLPGKTLAMLEGRHRGGGGNALRAAVLGANDGLVSNLSLVMGVAGAAANEKTILLTGFAGLMAGSCSMAMGEWLSVNSAREMAQRQIDAEAEELHEAPEMEKEELILIYQSKGLDEAAARAMADKLFRSNAAALDTLAREELGLDPKELGGSAWAAAASSFFLFGVGALFPVAAFLLLKGRAAFVASLAMSGLALMTIGGATSLFTGRGIVFSALRQLAIGLLAAGVTFGIGRLIGVSLN